jgi:hypothetical protein
MLGLVLLFFGTAFLIGSLFVKTSEFPDYVTVGALSMIAWYLCRIAEAVEALRR